MTATSFSPSRMPLRTTSTNVSTILLCYQGTYSFFACMLAVMACHCRQLSIMYPFAVRDVNGPSGGTTVAMQKVD